jgi:hypothetical protein
MQDDGNLVIYDAHGKPFFATGTNGKGDYVIVTNDGNVLVYGGPHITWSAISLSKARLRIP